jgi:hypothetical protein
VEIEAQALTGFEIEPESDSSEGEGEVSGHPDLVGKKFSGPSMLEGFPSGHPPEDGHECETALRDKAAIRHQSQPEPGESTDRH